MTTIDTRLSTIGSLDRKSTVNCPFVNYQLSTIQPLSTTRL
ncbi:MAG: hypothetical protein ACRC62_18220 [Microcoleus sp.]